MSGQSRAFRERQAALSDASPAPNIAPGHRSAAHTIKVIGDLAMLGHDNDRIATVLGINVSTFATWALQDSRIKRALAQGRDEADGKVARALHASAVGYKHRESKVIAVKDEHGTELQVVDIVKHYPPNVAAATLWLANRQRERWKDSKTVDHQVSFDLGALIRAASEPLERAPGDGAKLVEGQASTPDVDGWPDRGPLGDSE